jgi:hypothetical protein
MLQVALSLAMCTWYNQLKQVLCWSNGFIRKPPIVMGCEAKHRTELEALVVTSKIWHIKSSGS